MMREKQSITPAKGEAQIDHCN